MGISSPAAKPVVFSLTCQRQELFTRSLESLAAGLERHADGALLAVSDDSPRAETRRAKRGITRALAEQYTRPIVFIGREERGGLVERLLQALASEDQRQAAGFDLAQQAAHPQLQDSGINLNTMLSAASGRRCISFDDDTTLDTRVHRDSSDRVERRDSPPEFFQGVFSGPARLPDEIPQQQCDILSRFSSSLGTSEPPVRAAMAGIYGARWFRQPFGPLLYTGRLRDAMLSSRGDWRRALKNPYVYLQSPHTILSSAPVLVTTAFGIDATGVVPPFLPVGRNSDNLWAHSLMHCLPGSHIAHLPAAVYHDPAPKSGFSRADFRDTGMRLGQSLILLLHAAAANMSPGTATVPSDARFQDYGGLLLEFAALPPAEWYAFTRRIWQQHIERTRSHVIALLHEFDHSPRYWARDLQLFLQRLEASIAEPANWIPAELHFYGNAAAARQAHQEIVGEYGNLLCQWPEIWRTIGEINTSGYGLLGKQ